MCGSTCAIVCVHMWNRKWWQHVWLHMCSMCVHMPDNKWWQHVWLRMCNSMCDTGETGSGAIMCGSTYVIVCGYTCGTGSGAIMW